MTGNPEATLRAVLRTLTAAFHALTAPSAPMCGLWAVVGERTLNARLRSPLYGLWAAVGAPHFDCALMRATVPLFAVVGEREYSRSGNARSSPGGG